MILRFEHIQNVGTEGLRGFHHVGTGGIFFSGDGEIRRGAVDGNAGFEEGVDKFYSGRKVGLIGGNQIAAWVAELGFLHDFIVVFRGDAAVVGGDEAAGLFGRLGGAGGRGVVAEVGGFDGFDAARVGRPGVAAAALDGVFAHAPRIEEEGVALAGGVVEDGVVEGKGIGDGLGVVPFLRGDGEGRGGVGELA